MAKCYALFLLRSLILVLACTTILQRSAQAQTYANAQTNAVTGICLLCGVSNPNNAVNTDLSDYSQFNITAGLLGVSISQTLILPAVRNSGCDSLVVRIGSTNNSLSANLFGGITVQTFNGNVANNDSRVVDSSMVRLLQSNTLAEILLKPGQPFDRVKVTLNSSLVGLLTGLRIYFAYVNPGIPPAPQFTVPQGVVCGPQQLIISNHIPGNNYRVNLHYTSFTLPQPIDTSFTVINRDTIVTPDPQTYIFLQANISVQAVNPFTGCASDTTRQAFIQGGYAELPAVGADSVTICKGDSTTLYAYTPSSTIPTIKWYDAATGGNLLFSGRYFTVAPAVTTTYWVTSALDCEHKERRPVKVIVVKLPDPQYTMPQGFVCGASLLPVSNYQAGYNYRVRIIYTIFSTVLKDTSYTVYHQDTIPVAPFSTITGGNAKVFVQAVDTLTGCRSDSISQSFTVGGVPGQPVITPTAASICAGDTAVFNGAVPGSSLLQVEWFPAATGGSPVFTGNTFAIAPPASVTYYAGSRGTCRNDDRIPVTVTVNPCLSADAAKSENMLEVAPNPTDSEVRFTGKVTLAGQLLIVRDVNGKEVQRELLQQNRFSLHPGLQHGIYFIQVISRKGISRTTKIIYKGK